VTAASSLGQKKAELQDIALPSAEFDWHMVLIKDSL
jgi:hypothetical protein